eukprot:4649111-Pleurochrysis_carterae.AAC.1
MHARACVPEPHGSGTHGSRRRHCLHGCGVDVLCFCLPAQVRHVVVESCVASGDECCDDEQEAAHRESV